MIAPENCGCSPTACNIVNATFLSLDGFAALRRQMADDGSGYTADHFAGELARIVDREIASSQTFDRQQAETYCYGLLYDNTDHVSVVKTKIVIAVILHLFETDPLCAIPMGQIHDVLFEYESRMTL